MTVLDLLTEAYLMAGITALGEDLTAEESVYGLSKLNQMADMWAADRLAIPLRQAVGPFDVVAGTQEYLIGSGGTWDTPRPVWIDGANIVYQPDSDTPTELVMNVMTLSEYQRVSQKNVPSSLPRDLYYRREFTAAGYGQIVLVQNPSVACAVVLYVPTAVPEFADTTPTIALAPGYRMALVSNLAVLLALGVKQVDPSVAVLAINSYATIKSSNVIMHFDAMVTDSQLRSSDVGNFNWLDGGFT